MNDKRQWFLAFIPNLPEVESHTRSERKGDRTMFNKSKDKIPYGTGCIYGGKDCFVCRLPECFYVIHDRE